MIVIVEDDLDTRQLFRVICEMEGFRVVEAQDGREGIEVARGASPSLIVMDLSMPRMDGIDAAREMRLVKELRDVPILFVTAHGELGMDLFMRAGELGGAPIEYLPKPIDNAQLVETIRRLTREDNTPIRDGAPRRK